MPVKPLKATVASGRGSLGPRVRVENNDQFESLIQSTKDKKLKAKYKIEVIYDWRRSSLRHVPTALGVIVWESGRRLHGGGDEKMFWCPYHDCGRAFSSDNFGYQHAVCPHCQREIFLDPQAKADHIKAAAADGSDVEGLKRIPEVMDVRLMNVTPVDLAGFLVTLWHHLEGNADVYLKYSPKEIHYDKLHEDKKAPDKLESVREGRKPLIYTLSAIMKDIGAGADLRARFIALLTS
jgi:hypothetical protein